MVGPVMLSLLFLLEIYKILESVARLLQTLELLKKDDIWIFLFIRISSTYFTFCIM